MISVGILGSGNIGVDLAMRVLCDTDLNLVLVAGRRADSAGQESIIREVALSLKTQLINNHTDGEM